MLKLYRLPLVSARTMAIAPQPAMQTIQLQVPPDAHPGFMIQAQINGQNIQAQVPPGLQPGATFSVQVPAAPVDDPAANAAYDALLVGASRLTFSSKAKMYANEPYDTGPWSVEADTGATFQVTFDGPSKTMGHGDGSYNAQVVMGDDVVVQRFNSTGVATGNGMAASLFCRHPPVSQSGPRRSADHPVRAVDRVRQVQKVHLLQLAGAARAIDARRRRWPRARGAPFR